MQSDQSSGNTSAHHFGIASSSFAIKSQSQSQSPLNSDTHPVTSNGANMTDKSENNTQNQSSIDKNAVVVILQFLKKNNLLESEQTLRKETQLLTGLSDDEVKGLTSQTPDGDANISNVLSTYKSEGDPDIYEDNYNNLKKFIESSLDSYRHELVMLLYPVFVHMYLELVYNAHEDQAIKFMSNFGIEQEDYYQDDIKRLSVVTKKEHLQMNNEIIDNFRSEQNLFTLRVSRDSYNYLKRYLQEKSKPNTSIVQNIIQEHLYLDVYEGITRTKQQVECSAGGMMGEAKREANKSKVFYGLFKEPDLKIQIPDEDIDDAVAGDGTAEGSEKPKKKKVKKDTAQSKKTRTDPNAPPLNRIPLPELRDAEQIDKLKARNEAAKALKVGPEKLPSICFYTLLNAHHNHDMAALCAEISEDSSLLAAGFSDSLVRVWSLTPHKLKVMKSAQELELIDKEVDDVLYRMMDDKNQFDTKILQGHTGPVYAVSFSPARDLLLTCSEDSTIRLWSLMTWTNICIYKGHVWPVWDIRFSPHGYYFASCSKDRTARLWATDQPSPLRCFAGHISDVDCVAFHPNSNYIATGSTDRSVRIWDVLNGQCVRYLTGHKGVVYTLAFENTGRYLASSGADKRILFWDLAHGHLIAELTGHHDTIYTLNFSRGLEGSILSSGGMDDCINLWNVQGLIDDLDMEELNISHTPSIKTNTDSLLLGSYRTKSTSLLSTHFTRRNLLLSVGIFH